MDCRPPISSQPQVEMEHAADQRGQEAGPWQADVEQSTAKCRGSDSVYVLATVIGESVVCSRFVAFTADKYNNTFSMCRF
jgi:hypothetical protein